MTSTDNGANDLPRCAWATSDPLYIDYHDSEWGEPLHGDDAVFERLVLEGFQSGLSWLTILKKRENFRRAFAEFSISKVAAFGPDEFDRLMADAGIVRNKAKIGAAISNARAASALDGGLSAFVWSFQPEPESMVHAPTIEPLPEAKALSRALKAHGFVFVGPVTANSTMQAIGVVNHHDTSCFRYAELGAPALS